MCLSRDRATPATHGQRVWGAVRCLQDQSAPQPGDPVLCDVARPEFLYPGVTRKLTIAAVHCSSALRRLSRAGGPTLAVASCPRTHEVRPPLYIFFSAETIFRTPARSDSGALAIHEIPQTGPDLVIPLMARPPRPRRYSGEVSPIQSSCVATSPVHLGSPLRSRPKLSGSNTLHIKVRGEGVPPTHALDARRPCRDVKIRVDGALSPTSSRRPRPHPRPHR